MKPQNWAEKDIARGIHFLQEHETEASADTILQLDDDTTILLPSGLSAYGANITGIFMMAPILLFLFLLIFFPVRILWSARGVPITTVILISLCFLLAWGLIKVIHLMLKNRDLFPRCYFVTLGRTGITMHFSRFHFLWQTYRCAFTWKNVKSVHRKQIIFLPALFSGIPRVNTLEVISSDGEKIIIPFRPSGKPWNATADAIESLVSQKTMH